MGKYTRKTEGWSEKEMREALELLKDGKTTFKAIVSKFGISKSTLIRRRRKFEESGGQEGFEKAGHGAGKPLLSESEEQTLADIIVEQRESGTKISRLLIRKMCFKFCKDKEISAKFENEMASDDWYYGFLSRHESLIKPRRQGDNESSDEDEEDRAEDATKTIVTRSSLKKKGDQNN